MDFDLKLQFFATTTFLGGGSLIVTLYSTLNGLGVMVFLFPTKLGQKIGHLLHKTGFVHSDMHTTVHFVS